MSDEHPQEQLVAVVDAPSDDGEQGRFEVRVDGVRVGLTEYADADGLRTFPHTEVDEAYGGRGLATRLIGEALDATRAAGLGVVPLCPAVARFIARHDDYLDLVPPERRAEVGL